MTSIIVAGTRFGRLVVLASSCEKQVSVQCDCGIKRDMLRNNLIRGASKSCGCARKSTLSNMFKKHGECKSRLNNIWLAMRGRCQRKSCPDYKYYGGRGITVCPEWEEYSNFRTWALENGYTENLTIDRIDNEKGYGPSNCRWATRSEQSRNRRNTVFLPYNGREITIPEAAAITGKTPSHFYWKLRSGVNPDRIMADVTCERP